MNRHLLQCLVALVGLAWAFALVARGVPLPSGFESAYPIAVTACSVVVFGFDTWAWRWPLIRRLHSVPIVRGTWHGTFLRDLADSTDPSSGPFRVFLVVSQTYSSVHIRLFSLKSSSVSLSCGVLREPDSRLVLSWVYQNEPDYLERGSSEIHHGAAKVRLDGDPPARMQGHYWTDRKPLQTAGEMDFRLLSCTLVESFAQGEALARSEGARVDLAG